MFNHPTSTSHASGFANDSFAFSHQPWPKFDIDAVPVPSSSSVDHSSPVQHGDLHSFSSGMDWTPTSSDMSSAYQHGSHSANDVELDSLSPLQTGSGVGRLVAHFENKGFTPFDHKTYAPPLPPRPGSTLQTQQHQHQHQHQHHHQHHHHHQHQHQPHRHQHQHQHQHQQHQHQPLSRPPPFDNLAFFADGDTEHGNGLASPFTVNRVAVPASTDSPWASFAAQSRATSPTITSSPIAPFAAFQGDSRVARPGDIAPFSAHYGVVPDFLAASRLQSPIAPVPLAPSPALQQHQQHQHQQQSPPISGTPGFEIWRPPPSVSVKPETIPPAASASRPGGYVKPPVPTTPKLSLNPPSNQFILEFNPQAKAKGKAPTKPPRLRAPPPVPPRFSPDIKQEPATPHAVDLSPSSVSLPVQRQAPPTLRAHAGTRPSREQVPAEAWEQFKMTIRSLYLDERRPLKEVMAVMAEKYNFQATPKMYKTRFSQWGFVKNNTEDEVKKLLSMKFQRDAEGKVSEFVRNGRVVNLGTYLKRKGVTEYDLIDFELPADLPAHVKCRTPTPPPAPEYLRSPDLLRAQELVIGNMRKAFLHCRQLEVEGDVHIGWPVTMVWGAGSSDLLMEANFYFEARDADKGGYYLQRAFKQLELDLKKLSPLGIKELLLGMVQRDPGMMTALCKYLAAYSTTNLERSHPLRQIFTCLYELQQKHGPGALSNLLWGSIPTIAEELEAIYNRRHPYVARNWIDLALFYNHVHTDRLERLIDELRLLERQVEMQHGSHSADFLTLKYAILQLLYAVGPHSDSTKQAAAELWSQMKGMGLLFAVRDAKPNVWCYHSPVKVDPRTKRCRRRYDSGVVIMEEHMGVKVLPYFEEDFHTTLHAQDVQEAWSAALGHMHSKFSYI